MFKVEKTEYVNKTFRIDRSLLTRLETVAQQEDISINALVVQCCNYALNDMEDKKPTVRKRKRNPSVSQ